MAAMMVASAFPAFAAKPGATCTTNDGGLTYTCTNPGGGSVTGTTDGSVEVIQKPGKGPK